MHRAQHLSPLAFSVLLLASCASDPSGAAAWERSVVLSTGTKLGGCAVGDLDLERPGLEIAAVAENGEVWVAWREGDGWAGAAVANVGGEMIQCAIGDADLDSPGDELVVVGMRQGPESPGAPGRAHVIRHTRDGWVSEPIFDDASLLHAVYVAEGEVYVGGFSGRAFRVVRAQSGWRADPVADLPGAAKSAVGFRGGVVFACTDGSVVLLARDGAGFSTSIIDEREVGRARLGTDGSRLVVADDDGRLSLLSSDGGAERVYRAREKLRGAVIAELDPSVEGKELATVGYDRQVVLLRHDGGGWQSVVLAQEPDRLHHLACADIDATPGLELIAVGFSGDIVSFRRTR